MVFCQMVSFTESALFLRTRSPNWLRMLYRATRALRPVQTSGYLPRELIHECMFVPSRIELLDDLPHGGAIAEIGTYKGEFAQHILDRCKPRELHVFDLDFSRVNRKMLKDTRLYMHKGFASDAIAKLPDGYFDWIYLDADHSYEGTLRDAIATSQKVRPGGFLVFNDFAHIDAQYGRYGVHRAAVDFILEHRWPVKFFAFQSAGLYDIAIQRP
jgi:SAM-dependent methyltransferase